ncbi:hypothetical protein DOA20_18665 [Salmonella enterica subsp. enterica serovar Newport]|nr:hypothetical protein [Salmonella enterica subsp. enterica serovar Newport]
MTTDLQGFNLTALPALPAGGEGWRRSLRGVGRQRAPSTFCHPAMNRVITPRVTETGIFRCVPDLYFIFRVKISDLSWLISDFSWTGRRDWPGEVPAWRYAGRRAV